MAASNGSTVRTFAADLGLRFKHILELSDDVIARLSDLGGLSSEEMEALVSWTGKSLGNVRMSFRGEVFVTRDLRNPIVRGCPVCLRNDACAGVTAPLMTMTMRGDWLLRHAPLCIDHEHLLVPLWDVHLPLDRYDIGKRLDGVHDKLLAGAFDRPKRNPSPYDIWLRKRLEEGQDETWLADKSLNAATQISRLLGFELMSLDGRDRAIPDEEAEWSAYAKGFGVLSLGLDALDAALDDLIGRATGMNDEAATAFGMIYKRLTRELLDEPDFLPFRDILRKKILETWPIASGKLLLGQVVERRTLHSVRSASIETGLGAPLLQRFLAHAGAIDPNDKRHDTKKTFSAVEHQALLDEIKDLVGLKEMQVRMGATKKQFRALRDAGVLVPRFDLPALMAPWHPSDGLTLIEKLLRDASTIVMGDDRWEPIARSALRIRSSIRLIVAAVKDGRVRSGHRLGLKGFDSILVHCQDVDRIIRPDRGPDPTAAEFGRSIGIRHGAFFFALVSAGHTPATKRYNERTAREHYFMTKEDVTAFHARFITTVTIATESCSSLDKVRAWIQRVDLQPFRPAGHDYGRIYLRSEAEELGLRELLTFFLGQGHAVVRSCQIPRHCMGVSRTVPASGDASP